MFVSFISVTVTADGQFIHGDTAGISNSNQLIPHMSQAQSSQSSVQNGQTALSQEALASAQLALENSDSDNIGDWCSP